jgi:hypothetical protein
MMALLGAKRPQNLAWQWIVFSFWIIAALPAIQGLVLQPSEPLEVSTVWRWFYAILLLISAVNYLPTRYASASLLATAGQIVLFSPYLPTGLIAHGSPLLGIPMLCGAVCLARLVSNFPFTRQHSWRGDAPPLAGWTRVWIDFRNAYGLVWGARVMERIESLLQSSKAPAWLQWDGFHFPSLEAERTDHDDAQPVGPDAIAYTASEQQADLHNKMAAVETGIRNLLRRFVSNEWIDRRLNAPP